MWAGREDLLPRIPCHVERLWIFFLPTNVLRTRNRRTHMRWALADVACALIRWQHFAWNDVMAATLMAWIGVKNNRAKFHPDLIWNDGALGCFEEVSSTRRTTGRRRTRWLAIATFIYTYVRRVRYRQQESVRPVYIVRARVFMRHRRQLLCNTLQESRAIAVNFNTYRILQPHRVVPLTQLGFLVGLRLQTTDNVGIIAKVSEEVATEIAKMSSSTTPLSFDAPPRGTSANIHLCLIFLETRIIYVHLAADNMGLYSSFIFWWAS